MEAVKVNKLKIYLMTHGIKQNELSKKCGIGVTSLHHLINEGIGSEKTIFALADCLNLEYGKDITFEDISNMINESV